MKVVHSLSDRKKRCAGINQNTHIDTHRHTQTQTQTHARVHARAHTHTHYTLSHTHAMPHTLTSKLVHLFLLSTFSTLSMTGCTMHWDKAVQYTHTHTHSHTNTHTHTHTHPRSLFLSPFDTMSQTHTLTSKLVHFLSSRRQHALGQGSSLHAYTHAHTHPLSYFFPLSLFLSV